METIYQNHTKNYLMSYRPIGNGPKNQQKINKSQTYHNWTIPNLKVIPSIKVNSGIHKISGQEAKTKTYGTNIPSKIQYQFSFNMERTYLCYRKPQPYLKMRRLNLLKSHPRERIALIIAAKIFYQIMVKTHAIMAATMPTVA